MVTSSSADRRARLLGLVALTALPFVLVVVAVTVAGVAGGDAMIVTIAGVGGVCVAVVFAALAVSPRMRRMDAAVARAAALARGEFGERIAADDDEFLPLTAALNDAAVQLGEMVRSLQLERAQLEALLNASSDATVAVDAEGIVVYQNGAAARLFGEPEGRGVGRRSIEVLRDHDLNDLLISAARRGERSVQVIAYGAAQRWLQATAVPIEGAGAWAALAVFHDLTEVRRLDSVRRDFISNVSHELRTPLSAIRAAAETLQEGAIDDKPAATEFLGHIQRETDRMTQLVEELLELSRIESGAAPLAFTQLDVSALAQSTVKRFAQQAERAGLSIAAETPDGPLTVIGDGERLERALGNLIANSIKFTPAGGSIVLRSESDGPHVAISVRDTGAGIEPEQVGRVFERFYKADRGRGSGGTGLGLAIVKHIVLAHEGTVSVESRAGRGATFTMRLPRR